MKETMAELLAEYWIYLLIALVIGIIVSWWIFAANRKTTIARVDGAETTGVARRNQALIDAPATVPPPTPDALAGVGPAVAASAPAVPAGGDDLTRIKGVGPKVQAMLHGLGVTSFAQIAAWDDAEIDRIDGQLGSFAGRVRRDDWKAQAALLASDDKAAYEAKFGKL
jgi:predicted flap endonuclease-1-like 5' DNA nuclease